HSFYVPDFRIKRDAVPGRYTTAWLRPTVTGEYHLYCAEYCGHSHSRMRGRAGVVEPEDYAEWLGSGGVAQSMISAGRSAFMALGCSGCHVNGTEPAPRLEGLFNRMVVQADGSSILADEQYIRDSILLPQKHLVAG